MLHLLLLLSVISCIRSFVLDLGKDAPITIKHPDLKIGPIIEEYVAFKTSYYKSHKKKKRATPLLSMQAAWKRKATKNAGLWQTIVEDKDDNVYDIRIEELFALKIYTDDTEYCKRCRYYWRNDVQPPHVPHQFAAALFYGTHSPHRGVLWAAKNLETYMGMNGAELPHGAKEGELVNGGKGFFHGPWSTTKDFKIAHGFANARGKSPHSIIFKIEIPKGHDVHHEPGAIDVTWFAMKPKEKEVTMYNIPCKFVTYHKVTGIQQFMGGAHESYNDMMIDIYYDMDKEEAREKKEYRLITNELHRAQKERVRELGYIK